MRIDKNGISRATFAGQIMHALQRSNSPKLRKIWKTKLDEKIVKETKKEQN